MKAWLKDNGPAIAAFAGVVVAFVAVLQLAAVGPMKRGIDDLRSEMSARFDDLRAGMNQRFDQQDKYMNARFDAVDERFGSVDRRFEAVDRRFDDLKEGVNKRLDRLTDEVSELRSLVVGIGERVSRNEGQIVIIREQLQTVDAPAP